MEMSFTEKMPPAAAGGIFFLLMANCFGIGGNLSSGLLAVHAFLALLFLSFSLFIDFRSDLPLSTSAAILLFLFGFTAALTSVGRDNFKVRSSYTGIPPSSITSINVVFTTDPGISIKGGWIGEGVLVSAASSDVTVKARGKIVVFGSGDTSSAAAGRCGKLSGVFKSENSETGRSAAGGSGFVFYCKKIEDTGWKNDYFRYRHKILAELEKRLYSGSYDSGTFLAALLLGRRNDPGSPLIRVFRKSGCMHILALSGFHVGLIAFALKFLLKPLTGFKAASLLSAAGAIAFLLLAGIRPSLFRAVLMYILYTRDALRGYKIEAFKYLSAVFLMQAILFPASIYELSFGLSYLASAGIIVVGLSYYRLFYRYMPKKTSAVFSAGIGAQLLTLPVIISSFTLWYPIGIIAAPVLTAFSSAAMALGSLRMLFPQGSSIGMFISRVLDILVYSTRDVAGMFGRFPPVKISLSSAWLITSVGTIIPIILNWRIRREHPTFIEPRFPSLNTGLSRQQGIGPEKAMGTEFSHQSRSKKENYLSAGNRKKPECLGNRSRFGRHEPEHHRNRCVPHGFRNRPGILPLAQRVPGFIEDETGGRRCNENLEK